MIHLVWTLSAHTRYYLRRYMPTNRLLDAIRRRRNLRWGIPAMLLAAPYLLIASICTNALTAGAPGWLHLIVLWSVWNALKFIIMGPVSLILLIRARANEAVARRRAPKQGHPAESTAQKMDAARAKTTLDHGSQDINTADEPTTRRTHGLDPLSL